MAKTIHEDENKPSIEISPFLDAVIGSKIAMIKLL